MNDSFSSSLRGIRLLGLLAILFGLADPASAAKSVTHYGITWTFSADRLTGTFANGEPWVVGPVSITNINPNPSQSLSNAGTQHGSMKNPIAGTRNGFDSNPVMTPATNYDATKNVALSFPISLVAGDALVSSKTVYQYPNFMDTIAVLTVLSAAPPAGSFRPGPYGTDRTVKFNKSQINYSILKNFAPVSGAPSKAHIESRLPALPWFEWGGNFSNALLMPTTNTAAGNGGDGKPSTYGREIASKWGEIGLWLNLNHSQADKEKAMIQAIQCGIDIHSYATNGGSFYHDGGHKCGRKFPVFLAALALNDQTLLNYAKNPDIFQEDTQTFLVTQSDVGRAVDAPSTTYTQAHVGMGEWGVRHRWEPRKDDSRWTGGTPYRHVVWPAMSGAVLAADLMGRQAAWGHPAIFAYNQRYRTTSGIGGFTGNMWTAYKDGGTVPVVVVSTPSFSLAGGVYPQEQFVSLSSGTPGAKIRYTTNGSDPTTTTGTLYSGPVAIGVGTTTLKAIAFDGINVNSQIASRVYTVASPTQANAPTISPAGGSFTLPQLVTITSSTAGSSIYYTTDGSTPGVGKILYAGPITVSQTLSIKAIAVKSGLENSSISESSFVKGSGLVTSGWQNEIISPQGQIFVVEAHVTPSASGMDGVIGISGGVAGNYTDLAAIVRFSPTGVVDARDGGSYRAANTLTYIPGTRYTVRMTIDLASARYSATVSAVGLAPVLIADNYGFRLEQAGVESISNMAHFSTGGTLAVTLLESGNSISAPSAPRNLRIIR